MYEPKKYSDLIGLTGFSDQLLTNHFTLYEGYVTNVNKLIGLLDTQAPGTPEYSELQRRLGWEWNGMRLHELYFENLTTAQPEFEANSKLGKLIEKIYSSFENWQKNFIAVGSMRGIGWVVLYYDPAADELFNAWISEHDGGHLAGCTPLLVMDVFEHAYMIEYGLKKADYLQAFMSAIDWQIVENRLK